MSGLNGPLFFIFTAAESLQALYGHTGPTIFRGPHFFRFASQRSLTALRLLQETVVSPDTVVSPVTYNSVERRFVEF